MAELPLHARNVDQDKEARLGSDPIHTVICPLMCLDSRESRQTRRNYWPENLGGRRNAPLAERCCRNSRGAWMRRRPAKWRKQPMPSKLRVSPGLARLAAAGQEVTEGSGHSEVCLD